ncbi:MAG: hypothetical protein NC417_12250 [Candidatus Gastranaerophilales bacterium]|nr:hypothetical protein [Candidatus Gastranaerophilales bacterium]
MTALVIAGCVVLLALLSIYMLYRGVFLHPPRKHPNAHCIPDSNLYRAHKDRMLECVEEMERMPHEEVSILSQDGLRLCGKLYPGREGAPLILFFHGFHGVYAWDGYGFFKLCKKRGFPILMVDERAHGKSEGNVITFGIRERYDCKLWAEYAVDRFEKDIDIFPAGVSMGAASVLMSLEVGLPENVRAVIADCGYSEPAAIIKETIRTMKLPVKLIYPFIRLGAYLFGRFDLESASAIQSVRRTNIPILFIHGAQDSIVPLSMGETLYQACSSKKEWLQIEGADHANSAMTDYETYEKAVLQFIEKKTQFCPKI